MDVATGTKSLIGQGIFRLYLWRIYFRMLSDLVDLFCNILLIFIVTNRYLVLVCLNIWILKKRMLRILLIWIFLVRPWVVLSIRVLDMFALLIYKLLSYFQIFSVLTVTISNLEWGLLWSKLPVIILILIPLKWTKILLGYSPKLFCRMRKKFWFWRKFDWFRFLGQYFTVCPCVRQS